MHLRLYGLNHHLNKKGKKKNVIILVFISWFNTLTFFELLLIVFVVYILTSADTKIQYVKLLTS